MNSTLRRIAFVLTFALGAALSVSAMAANYRCTLDQPWKDKATLFLQMDFETSAITGMIKHANFKYRAVHGSANTPGLGELKCKHTFVDAKCSPDVADSIVEWFHLSRKGVEFKAMGVAGMSFMKCAELRSRAKR